MFNRFDNAFLSLSAISFAVAAAQASFPTLSSVLTFTCVVAACALRSRRGYAVLQNAALGTAVGSAASVIVVTAFMATFSDGPNDTFVTFELIERHIAWWLALLLVVAINGVVHLLAAVIGHIVSAAYSQVRPLQSE
jgi:hypothetical protein